jgi:hypothetical protein
MMGQHFDSSNLVDAQKEKDIPDTYLTEPFTNRDIFGTVRGRCNNVRPNKTSRKPNRFSFNRYYVGTIRTDCSYFIIKL